jgi:thymidylate kinase
VILQHHFPGFLIAIEGIDGAGKTTQAQQVQDALQAQNWLLSEPKSQPPDIGGRFCVTQL